MTIRELADIMTHSINFDGGIKWDDSKPEGMMRKLTDAARSRAIGFVPEDSRNKAAG
jgi:GDP-L-fucose synthase